MNDQLKTDLDHLKILSICHFVLAAFTLIPALIGGIYVVFGLIFGVAMMADKNGAAPGAMVGGFFVVFGLIFVGVFLTVGALIVKSGLNLSKQKSHTFSFIIACIMCLWMPFGTVLGIFTIIVLNRDSVKALYNGNAGQYGAPQGWQQ